MTNVMKKAWEIAREGAARFGGKASEYFAEALKMAWALIKKVKETVEVVTSEGSRNNKSWVAEIVGTHARWGLDRKFMEEQEDEYRDKTFILGSGIYEVCNAGEREFIKVENGEIEYIEYNEVMKCIA